MGWEYRETEPDYDFAILPRGRIEFRDRLGQYRVVSGCSALAVVGGEYQYRYQRAIEIRQEAPDAVGDAELYQQHPEFRHCCDELLRMHGIDLDWVTVDMVLWLVFPRREGDAIAASPLQILNAPRPARRAQAAPKDGDRNDAVALLAALASVAGGDLGRAKELAESPHGVELLEAMGEIAWHSMSGEQKNKQEFDAWAHQRRAEQLDLVKAMQQQAA